MVMLPTLSTSARRPTRQTPSLLLFGNVTSASYTPSRPVPETRSGMP